jgi:hypothetical protein
MSDVAYEVSCGVALIEQRLRRDKWFVGTCLMEDHRVVRETMILQLYCINGGSRCLKIGGRKVVCELLLAARLLDFLFTHFFDNRFDEFGNCQKITVTVAFRSTVFSFHDRFYRCDRDKVC